MDISALGTRQTESAAAGRRRLIRVLTVLFVAGALYATVVAFLWFAADFIAASIYSPNLDQAQQVSDFNDFAYISDMLARYRFLPGVLALVMAVALMVMAVVINDPRQRSRPVFIAGGVALFCLALLLAQGFSWIFALLFAATAVMLFLATDWSGQQVETLADTTDVNDHDTAEVILPDTASDDEAAPEPVLPTAIDADENASSETPAAEKTAPATSEKTIEEAIEPLIAAEPRGEAGHNIDEQAVESFGLELESDINLDLEPDYELASDPETENDPLMLLSQEDLGIEDDGLSVDDTIETAAAIEAEIEAEMSLDQADTAQIKAMIDSASDAFETTALPEDDAKAAREAEVPEPAVKPQAMAFDPQALARQESLLPPPRARAWSLLDWIILMIIVVSIVMLLIINL